MKNDSELFEIESRYCPICGNFIKSNTPLHRCLDEDIKRIEKEEKLNNLKKELDKDRTYDDKLSEFDKFYNSDNYYDNDDDGEE